jgi:hypothetical protein
MTNRFSVFGSAKRPLKQLQCTAARNTSLKGSVDEITSSNMKVFWREK